MQPDTKQNFIFIDKPAQGMLIHLNTSLEQILSPSGLKLYLQKPLYIKIKSISSTIRFLILIFLDYFFRLIFCIVNGPSYISTICTANIFLIFKKNERFK